MLLRVFSLIFLILFTGLLLPLDAPVAQEGKKSPYNNYSQKQFEWVENEIQSMSLEEKIGQLFMVAAYSNKDEAHKQEIARIIKQHHIGGLIFFQGTPTRQANLCNYFQSVSKRPLLIAIDGEWGLSMRLDDVPVYPKQLMLGAIQDNRYLYEMGKEVARQCKRLGIHVNLAPVVDVNNNPNNPVINDRSFGENKYNVAEKGISYMQGMEMNGIIACAKHFPGHGDTDKDSHYSLPVIHHGMDRLRDIELYPFQELSKMGVGGMMIAHLSIPALDDTPLKEGQTTTIPTTLSHNVVTSLLKEEMAYEGLIFTDALNMKGVSAHFPPGIVDLKALLAGNDILLFPENVGKAVQEIKKAITNQQITESEIDTRVRKILNAKFRVGLSQYKAISLSNLDKDLNLAHTNLLNQHLIEQSLTLAKNDYSLIPLQQLNQKSFATLSIGSSTLNTFQNSLSKYAPMQHHSLKLSDSEAEYQKKLVELKGKDVIIVSVHGMSKKSSKNYGISQKSINLIKQLQRNSKVIISIFGSPYSLKFFDESSTVLMAYQDTKLTQDLAAQLLFGAIPALGRLPITASPVYPFGCGISTPGGMRLKYTIPEDTGLNSDDFKEIDEIIKAAILEKATPGCQVLVAKNGKVIFDKSYGHHSYSKRNKVQNNDLYDVASLTKITASSLGLMELYETGQLNLDAPLGEYLPELNTSNKANLKIKDILIHESGLEAWIPFYKETLPAEIRKKAYNASATEIHSIEIADKMFLAQEYQNNMWESIRESDLPHKGNYKYSDLGYYYLKSIIERVRGRNFDLYSSEWFYEPLGLPTIGFKPKKRFSTRSIVPSENDLVWRKQIVHGHVHDMGAAMLGGVSGHAGIFSNANDIAVVMQMLLDKGVYGGSRYFNESTIELFTSKQKKGNRRGLCFDKPDTEGGKNNHVSEFASGKTFGHTGFTGTCAWADPEHDLVFVFLSNRTYPKMNNYKLLKSNVRTRIQDVIYSAIMRQNDQVANN